MFKRATTAKFEWANPPADLTSLDIEFIILKTRDNFAVSLNGVPRDDEGEYWSAFNTLTFTKKYGVPTRISQTFKLAGTRVTDNFCLYRRIAQGIYEPTPMIEYMRWYSEIIKNINHALTQHVVASELIAKIVTSNQQEKAQLEQMFKVYEGIKIVQRKSSITDSITGNVDFVQFNITPRLEELENLKHKLENDCFLRCGIDNGIDKSHITNANLEDSEQAIDLINAYELKRREDFAERYNKFVGRSKDNLLTPTIHTISRNNSIQQTQGGATNDDE